MPWPGGAGSPADIATSGAKVIVTGQDAPLDPQAYERRVMRLVGAARWHGSNVALINTIVTAIGADSAASKPFSSIP
jgi:hypothetical protein